MESPNSNEEMMIENEGKKIFDPNDIKVNTVIDLNPEKKHKKEEHNHHTQNEAPITNLHLKSAFSVADVKYSEECKCGPSVYVDVSFSDHRKRLFKNTKIQ